MQIASHDDVVIDMWAGGSSLGSGGSGNRGDGVGEFSGDCSGEVVGVGSCKELLALLDGVPRTHDVFRFVCWVKCDFCGNSLLHFSHLYIGIISKWIIVIYFGVLLYYMKYNLYQFSKIIMLFC